MEGFIVIVLTGVLQAFVLCVPHGMRYLLGSSCWLIYTCQVHRNKVIICSSQSLLQQNVWLGSPAGSCQGLSALQYMVVERSGSWTKSSSCSSCPTVLALTWTLQESQPLLFPLFHIKGLCIQESTFFSPSCDTTAAFNKGSGEHLVHLTSP